MFHNVFSTRWAPLRLAVYSVAIYFLAGDWLRGAVLFAVKELSILLGAGFSWPVLVLHDPLDAIILGLLLTVVPLGLALRWFRTQAEIWVLVLALHLNLCLVLAGPVDGVLLDWDDLLPAWGEAA